MPESPIPLTVEFLADGRCVVGGASLSAADSSTAARPQPNVEAPGAKAVPRGDPGGGFRCPLPLPASGTPPVRLHVLLPRGAEPPGDAFPRLVWHYENARWIGASSLPATPSFVSLAYQDRVQPPGAATAAFGWNFYGFFLFAVAFIAVYLGWARWMRGRDLTRVASQ